MDDLVRWLGEQLDEEERIARAVEDRSAPFDGQWMADGNSAVRTLNGHVLFYRHDSGPLKPGLVDHVVAHDPARVLREIESKRELLRRYEALTAGVLVLTSGAREIQSEYRRVILPSLAAGYSDRPGFLEEWRP